MKQGTSAKGKLPNIAILVFLLLLVSPLAFASFTQAWGEYQDDSSNRGFVHDDDGFFGTEAETICSLTTGYTHQVLSDDFNSDGDYEFLLFRASSIQVYNENCDIEYELNIGQGIESQPSLYNTSAVTFIGQDNLSYIYSINSPITQIKNHTLEQTCIDYTGVTCRNNNCYAICDANGANSYAFRWNLTHIDNETLTPDEISTKGSPAVNPLRSTAYDSIAFGCDSNDNGTWGYCVLRSDTLALDTGFNGDGILESLSGNYDANINQPLIYDIDGGNNELITSFTWCDENAAPGDVYEARTYAIEDDGTTLWSDSETIRSNVAGTCGTTQGFETSMAVIATKDSQDYVCFVSSCDDMSACAFGGFKCLDSNGNVAFENGNLVTGVYPIAAGQQMSLVAASMLNVTETLDDDLVFEWGIIDLDTNLTRVNFTSPPNRNASLSLVDLNQDRSLDVIFGDNAYTNVFGASGFVNQPPTVFTNRTFGVNFQTPICLGTTVTFSANEGVHYSNDVSDDQERLVSSCGVNISNFANNGTFSTANPRLSCDMGNSIGSYAFNVYLQDDQNPLDLSQSKSFTYVVANGTAGVTCNLPVSPDTAQGIVTATVLADDLITTEQDIIFVVETVTGQSDFMKFIIVMIATIGFIFFLAKPPLQIKNPLIYVVTIWMLWMIFSAINLWPWIYTVLYSVVVVAVAGIMFTIGRDTSE